MVLISQSTIEAIKCYLLSISKSKNLPDLDSARCLDCARAKERADRQAGGLGERSAGALQKAICQTRKRDLFRTKLITNNSHNLFFLEF